MIKMIPPVPTSAVMMPTPKQKIGFSIESIVGNDAAPSTNSTQQNIGKSSELQSQQSPTMSPASQLPSGTIAAHHNIQDIINRLHNSSNNNSNNNNNNNSNNNNNNNSSNSSLNQISHNHLIGNLSENLSKSNYLLKGYSPPPIQTRLSPEDSVLIKREKSPLSIQLPVSTASHQSIGHPPNSPQNHVHHHHLHQMQHQQHPQQSPASPAQQSPQDRDQRHREHQQHQQQQPLNMNKGPIVVPGIPPGLVRPFPVAPPPNMPDIKALPPYISTPEMVPPQHNPHLLAAAQFQMAAALQAGHVLGPAGAAAAAAGLPPHSPFLPNPGVPRDSYPLYPWLLSRHGRIFPHRFPGNFLLQPFRKPKRIRTAFSPSQLLKLEHAFESNQYVVGAERKALAQSLNLSETQVKVWFQNRRTKHKRMQQEDEKGPSGNGGGNGGSNHGNSERNSNNNNTSCDEEDEELIDMEMDDDDCPSDDDLDASH